MSIMSGYLFRDKLAAGAGTAVANAAWKVLGKLPPAAIPVLGTAVGGATLYGGYKGIKALRNRKKAKPEAQTTATAPNTGTSPAAIKQAYWQGVADVLDSLGF